MHKSGRNLEAIWKLNGYTQDMGQSEPAESHLFWNVDKEDPGGCHRPGSFPFMAFFWYG